MEPKALTCSNHLESRDLLQLGEEIHTHRPCCATRHTLKCSSLARNCNSILLLRLTCKAVRPWFGSTSVSDASPSMRRALTPSTFPVNANRSILSRPPQPTFLRNSKLSIGFPKKVIPAAMCIALARNHSGKQYVTLRMRDGWFWHVVSLHFEDRMGGPEYPRNREPKMFLRNVGVRYLAFQWHVQEQHPPQRPALYTWK